MPGGVVLTMQNMNYALLVGEMLGRDVICTVNVMLKVTQTL